MIRIVALSLLLTGCVFTSDAHQPAPADDDTGTLPQPSSRPIEGDGDGDDGSWAPPTPRPDVGDGDGDTWPGECACADPGPGSEPPDDGEAYCGCGIIGAEDSYCYSADGCAYFHGGCPDGWATICL